MTSEEYYEQGKIHWEAGEYDEAEEHFAQALELEPEWARAWHGLGRLYFSREQYEEAVDAFQQSTALEEENPIHWLSLARAYTYLKLPNEALEAYQKSVKLNRQAAARFSFLLSIPVITGAGTLKLWQLVNENASVDWAVLAVGALVSGLVAYLCIALFLRLLDRVGLMPFVYYRVLLAAVLYGLWLA